MPSFLLCNTNKKSEFYEKLNYISMTFYKSNIIQVPNTVKSG